MLILTEEEIKNILPVEKIQKVIDAVERGFLDYAQGKVQMPAKQYLDFREYQGDLRIMPCYSKILKLAGTKIVNVHPGNPEKGLPAVMATIILNNPENGQAVAQIGGTWITGMRTGAAGAVAVKYLAKKNVQTLGVVGAGQQAFFQIAAVTKTRPVREIRVYDPQEENIEKLAKNLKKLGIAIKKTSLEEAAQSDILTTTTPVRRPIVKDEWILPGAHINAIGADAPGKQELDPKILKRAKIVIDHWEQASHSGEINLPLSQGIIQKKDIYAELGEIVAGKARGRINEDEITIFDSTGLAFQDLYTAALLIQSD